MDADLRDSDAYREVEAFFRRVLEPGFGRIANPSDPQPSPDGRWVAFRGDLPATIDFATRVSSWLARFMPAGAAEPRRDG